MVGKKVYKLSKMLEKIKKIEQEKQSDFLKQYKKTSEQSIEFLEYVKKNYLEDKKERQQMNNVIKHFKNSVKNLK